MNEGARGSGCIVHSAQNGASRDLNDLKVEFLRTEQDRELSPRDRPSRHLCQHKRNPAILSAFCTCSTSALDLYVCVRVVMRYCFIETQSILHNNLPNVASPTRKCIERVAREVLDLESAWVKCSKGDEACAASSTSWRGASRRNGLHNIVSPRSAARRVDSFACPKLLFDVLLGDTAKVRFVGTKFRDISPTFGPPYDDWHLLLQSMQHKILRCPYQQEL